MLLAKIITQVPKHEGGAGRCRPGRPGRPGVEIKGQSWVTPAFVKEEKRVTDQKRKLKINACHCVERGNFNGLSSLSWMCRSVMWDDEILERE